MTRSLRKFLELFKAQFPWNGPSPSVSRHPNITLEFYLPDLLGGYDLLVQALARESIATEVTI
jgi:hypothetical protein